MSSEAPAAVPTASPTPATTASKLAEIPVVNTAVGTVSQIYNQAKEYNPTIKQALEKVESVSKEYTKPIVESALVQKVDALGAAGVEKLTTAVPILKEEPGKVLEAGQQKLQEGAAYTKTVVTDAYANAQKAVSTAQERVSAAYSSTKETVGERSELLKQKLSSNIASVQAVVDPYIVSTSQSYSQIYATAMQILHERTVTIKGKVDALSTELVSTLNAAGEKTFASLPQSVQEQVNSLTHRLSAFFSELESSVKSAKPNGDASTAAPEETSRVEQAKAQVLQYILESRQAIAAFGARLGLSQQAPAASQ
eukprot:Colp12_sorted_trinity150504_noHs@29057